MRRLENKVALITGAAQGVGKEIAKLFVSEGAKACIADINYKGVKKLEEELIGNGFEVISLKADISNIDDIKKMVGGTIERFGNIDILVNNASVGMTKPMMNLKWEDWDLVLDVNLKGTFFVLQNVARKMIEIGKGGSIVNIASIAGEGGRPLFLSYASSKAAIINVTQSTSLELSKYNIRVNAISPGTIDTPMWEEVACKLAELEKRDVKNIVDSWVKKIPLKRLAKTKDIASAVLFLCSDEAAYITGQTLNVCGGLSV